MSLSLFTTKRLMPDIISFALVMILFCGYELLVISKKICVDGNGRCRYLLGGEYLKDPALSHRSGERERSITRTQRVLFI